MLDSLPQVGSQTRGGKADTGPALPEPMRGAQWDLKKEPRGCEREVTSPSPEEFLLQNDKDTHTRVCEYRVLTPGTPQRGQLLSPKQDREGFELGADG